MARGEERGRRKGSVTGAILDRGNEKVLTALKVNVDEWHRGFRIFGKNSIIMLVCARKRKGGGVRVALDIKRFPSIMPRN